MRYRISHTLQILPAEVDHAHAREIETISTLLDSLPEITRLVERDLLNNGTISGTVGHPGMPADMVLRALIIKQMNGFSYEALSFHLADSLSYRRFCRIGAFDRAPSDSALQENIARITPATLEAINRQLVHAAAERNIEKGRTVRIDATVVATDIHEPSDSALLYDVVRLLTRLTAQAAAIAPGPCTDHTRRAKRRFNGIRNAKNDRQRRTLYRDLLMVTGRVIDQAQAAVERLRIAAATGRTEAVMQAADIEAAIVLGRRVVDQTRRRVFHGEIVPAQEKVVSIFEPHTDIIVKDRRDTLYGHKVYLTTGRSSLVTDCQIVSGNPADSSLAADLVRRQTAIYGRPPRQVAFDGGFASKDNLAVIKAAGVSDVMFSKRRGIALSEMVKSSWVYKRLWRFRAGIEGCISFLKRAFGLDRCSWNGEPGFKAYVWSSVLSANLLILARHLLA